MRQTEIFRRIRIVIYAETAYLPEDFKITEETAWKDLEMDSLDALNIVMALEHIFNIQIPDMELNRFFDGTVMDSMKIMEELLKPFE